MSEWQPPETAPKDGKPFVITTAGPELDLCSWVEERGEFVDYFFKQRIAPLWPYMVAWKPLGEPAKVGNTKAECRLENGWIPAPEPSP